MTGKVEKRRAALRARLVELATAQIAAEGLSSLKARQLAQQADCAVGAIYNVFEDMTALTLEVNGHTFKALGETVQASLVGAETLGPNERLIRMSHAYLAYASANNNLWRALFDVEMSADSDVPEWYRAALSGLFALISKPLSELFPDKPAKDLGLLTRALFSSVHGIVLLGLENRLSGVPTDQIAAMISQILGQIRKNERRS